jgi:hypothetical protein
MPLADRGKPCPSLLKPAKNVQADAQAEAIGLRALAQLSRRVGCPIRLIVDVAAGTALTIGHEKTGPVIWASFDAIDGTIKVAGLGNALPGRVRAANDGAWAASFAFTAPTMKPLQVLTLGDFVVAAVVDGNPTRCVTYPQDVVTLPGANGLETYDVTATRRRRVFTSTNTNLSQSMVFLDGFQAYDYETCRAGDDALAVELYRQLINRHAGGAYDVIRQFGSLSALSRMMLGWRDGRVWYESQGAAFIVVNENLPNLIPAVPIIDGAGGICVDLDNQSLRRRALSAGRTSIVYAANESVRRHVLRVVRAARKTHSGGHAR